MHASVKLNSSCNINTQYIHTQYIHTQYIHTQYIHTQYTHILHMYIHSTYIHSSVHNVFPMYIAKVNMSIFYLVDHVIQLAYVPLPFSLVP